MDLREAAEKAKGKVRSGHGAPRSPEERLKAGVPYSESPYSPKVQPPYHKLTKQNTSMSRSATIPHHREGPADRYRMRKGLRADEF